MSTAFAYVPSPEHTLRGHPESVERFALVWRLFDETGVLGLLEHIAPQAATMQQLRRVHTAHHIQQIQWAAAQGGGMIDQDTYATAATLAAARLAAGSAAAVADSIAAGRAANGLAVVRPPGHHASADRAEGFCLFNNVAVAVRQAQTHRDIRRVLVIDFDVHHGNGTQAIFYDDPSVLFVSLHQFGRFFYPGTGSLAELGLSSGHGWTLNVPFPAGVGNAGYAAVFEQVVQPKVAAFRPNMIVVSAGFDAHWRDPLAQAQLSLAGFNALIQQLMGWAETMCDGRIAFVAEGGYDHEILAYGLLNIAYALLAHDQLTDPFGGVDDERTDLAQLMRTLRAYHLIQ